MVVKALSQCEIQTHAQKHWTKLPLNAKKSSSDPKEEICVILHLVRACAKYVRGCTATVIRNLNIPRRRSEDYLPKLVMFIYSIM